METISQELKKTLREFLKRYRHLGVIGFSSIIRDNHLVIYVDRLTPVVAEALPQRIQDLELEFKEIGKPKAQKENFFPLGLEDRTKYIRPIIAGVSVGHYKITAGTIGWFVELPDGSIGILSNNHVLAYENKGKKGDTILQPGRYDLENQGLDPSDIKYKCGELYIFKEISFEEFTCPYRNFFVRKFLRVKSTPNYIDVAVARLTVEYKFNIYELGGVSGEADAEIGLRVKKSGRTTGVTHGEIIDTHYNGYIWYSRGRSFYENQLLIQSINEDSFSKGGDSGSLIVTEEDNRFVGLLFAGSEKVTIANNKDYVVGWLHENNIKVIYV